MQQIKLKDRGYGEQRYPNLGTMMMVEETLMNADGEMTIAELKRKLPKQVMHQTLMLILDYLNYSNKILLHDNKVLWIYNPDSKLWRMKGTKVR
ncbi:MAG TPA: hypothetical protein VJC07_00695 [Candidatus Nanoarchaeia archaeon]|nr:hypothetical protein [Candidatus Nanoarchaeia archaeon]